jgi:serine/threonine protein phosphatase PrpC
VEPLDGARFARLEPLAVARNLPHKAPMASVTFDTAGLTHVGRERSRNEDQFLIARLERRLRVEATSVTDVAPLLPAPRDGTLLLVADGMGGAAAGDIASAVAVRTIVDYVCNVMPWATAVAPVSGPSPPLSSTLPGVRVGLSSALRQGDVAIREVAHHRGGRSMGTTTTLAYVQWPHLYVAHVGDSRCYLLRDGEMLQITTDHTLAEKLRARTDITVDESSPWHHVLWNALGAGDHRAVEPEVHRHLLEDKDVLLLCSDGLTKHLDDDVIADVLGRSTSAALACERLVDLANRDGGSDNITAVVCYCDGLDVGIDSEAPTMAIAAIDSAAVTERQPPYDDE